MSRIKIFFGVIMFCFFCFFIMSYQGFKSGNVYIADYKGEGKIYGRLAESRKNGVFSHAGLLGWSFEKKDRDAPRGTRHYMISAPYQAKKYYFGVSNDSEFDTYWSQTGGQAVLYYYLDKLYHDPLMFRGFCALLMAAVLVCWLKLMSDLFGNFVAFSNFLGILYCCSILRLGDNIAHVIGADYLVFVAIFWAYQKKIKHLDIVIFFILLFKLLISGAEFLFAVLLLPFIPLVFYAVLSPMSLKKIRQDAYQITKGVIAASLVALFILLLQVTLLTHSIQVAIMHFIERLEFRTLVISTHDYNRAYDNIYSSRITMVDLLHKYLNYSAIEINGWSMAYGQFIIFLVFVSLLAFYIYHLQAQRSLLALLVTTWVSILCPLSWIILAKGHSSSVPETHIDQYVWGLPFMLLALVLIAVTLKQTYLEVVNLVGHRASSAMKNNERS